MIRSKSFQSQNRQISGINITPFTDVCLVLLIIFLVTASTFSQEKSVNLTLPKAEHSDKLVPKTVTVHITRAHDVDVNNVPVGNMDHPKTSKLKATLEWWYQRNLKKTGTLMVLKADAQVPYQTIVTVIDTAAQVGLSDISLATQRP